MEKWRPVPDLKGYYEVSNMGNIRSLDRTVIRSDGRCARLKGKPMKQRASHKGYNLVCLCKNGKVITKSVHRLVALAFINNDDENLDQVDHIDGNKLNNSVDNLRWCDNSQNQRYAYALGKKSNKGIKHPRASIDEDTVKNIRSMIKTGSHRSVANKLGVSIHIVRDISRNKTWRHI